jgi:hypothetical protein
MNTIPSITFYAYGPITCVINSIYLNIILCTFNNTNLICIEYCIPKKRNLHCSHFVNLWISAFLRSNFHPFNFCCLFGSFWIVHMTNFTYSTTFILSFPLSCFSNRFFFSWVVLLTFFFSSFYALNHSYPSSSQSDHWQPFLMIVFSHLCLSYLFLTWKQRMG